MPLNRWKEGLLFEGIGPTPGIKSATNWFPRTETLGPVEIRIIYKAVRRCWDGEEGYSKSVSGSGGGPVEITGTIDSGPMDWVLDLQAESQGLAQSLAVDLIDIELGPYMLENTPTP